MFGDTMPSVQITFPRGSLWVVNEVSSLGRGTFRFYLLISKKIELKVSGEQKTNIFIYKIDTKLY